LRSPRAPRSRLNTLQLWPPQLPLSSRTAVNWAHAFMSPSLPFFRHGALGARKTAVVSMARYKPSGEIFTRHSHSSRRRPISERITAGCESTRAFGFVSGIGGTRFQRHRHVYRHPDRSNEYRVPSCRDSRTVLQATTRRRANSGSFLANKKYGRRRRSRFLAKSIFWRPEFLREG
jgi:hypothetical protein